MIENHWQEQRAEGNSRFKTVLVLQGGGSLGAYECGVYSTLYKHGIKFNILAGSSIGAINASIIASAQNLGKNAAHTLKEFWLTLAEDIKAPFLPSSLLLESPFLLPPIFPTISIDKMIAVVSSMFSIMFGNPNAFMPRWFAMPLDSLTPDNYFPYTWNYLHNTAPLKRTLNEYIDFRSLRKNPSAGENEELARLILTSTDIQKGGSVIFDSKKMDIDVDRIVACASYPFYGIKWSEKNGQYLWDGSLLTNTPILEVIDASPETDKDLYIVDVFPREQKEIPRNMVEVWHRARDIIFMDKTDRNIEMAKDRQRYMDLLKKINDIIHADGAQIDDKTRAKLKDIEPEYNELAQMHGGAIKNVTRIGRIEKFHYIFEDADFSLYRINKLITEGEEDAERILKKK